MNVTEFQNWMLNNLTDEGYCKKLMALLDAVAWYGGKEKPKVEVKDVSKTIKEMYLAGETYEKMMDATGLNHSQVATQIRRMHLNRRPMTAITPELVSKMQKLRDSGFTCKDVAKKLGCSYHSVARHTKGGN